MTETTQDTYWQDLLDEATEHIDAAREAMSHAQPGSKAWRIAAEDLDWWIGRKAFVAAAIPAKTCTGCHAPLRGSDPDLCSLCDVHSKLDAYGAKR